MRLTPIKSYQTVYVNDKPKAVIQSWGDYIKSAVRNYIVLKKKYGIRFKVK